LIGKELYEMMRIYKKGAVKMIPPKKTYILLVVITIAIVGCLCLNNVHAVETDSEHNIVSQTNSHIAEMSTEEINMYLTTDNLNYYAYMEIESADPQIKPIIVEARNRIIYNTSWVDDDLNGWVTDEFGNVIAIVPHFSEVFPDDWEIPQIATENIEVDLSYYGIQ